jgi:hypothetical protein
MSIETVRAAEVGPTLQQAQSQLAIAIQQAEVSLQPHQPGSGHTKQHMQQMLNVIQGRSGKDFNAKVENPGDGKGLTIYLESAQETLKGQHAPSDVQQALAQTMTLVQEAIHHAKRSVQGSNVQETHTHAGLAAGLLVAAAGREESDSPITGCLGYVMNKTRTDGESPKGRH